MTHRWRGLAAALATVITLIQAPAPAAGQLTPGETVTIRAVVDGDTVILEGARGDALQIRLVGIQAPKLPLGRPGFVPWPLAGEAKRALEKLALGRRVTLSYGGRRIDRHGRRLAHLYGADGTWIQGEMLKRGLARVYSFADNRALIAEMLAIEKTAREQRQGIWRNPYYQIRDEAKTRRHINSFQLVEGRVVDVAVIRGRAYINFGADWRTDFTISLAPRVVRLFRREKIDLGALENKRIRVRGWLKSFNGPMIEATHPEQIEVLE